jgi:hypothetical protein
MYDNILRSGAEIQITASSTREIKFTYVPAGAARDAEYVDSSKDILGKGLVATIDNGKVTLTYYDKNGEPMTNGEPIVPEENPPK